jgi:hypothetical protein
LWILRERPESFRDTEKERCSRQEDKRRMNPILVPRTSNKVLGGFKLQTQWSVDETPVSPLPMSLTWGCQRFVRSGVSLCFKAKAKKKEDYEKAWE